MQYDDTSGATFWPNFELMQMVPPGDQVANSAIGYKVIPEYGLMYHGSVEHLSMFAINI